MIVIHTHGGVIQAVYTDEFTDKEEVIIVDTDVRDATENISQSLHFGKCVCYIDKVHKEPEIVHECESLYQLATPSIPPIN